MLCLSLCQPYASLLAFGIKKFETRGWKPGDKNLAILREAGFLIHASASKKFSHLMGEAPFARHLSRLGPLPYGAIIGWAKIGSIMRVEQWRQENIFPGTPRALWPDEYFFGDYEPGRWAWQITQWRDFCVPTPVKGKLSLWDYDGPLRKLELIHDANGMPAFFR